MEWRQERVVVETERYRIEGNLTLPREGYRSRLSDHLNRRDQEFFTLLEAKLTRLEVGPGTGYYSLPVAEWIGPQGSLDILDLQQEMLDHTLRRAAEAGIANLAPTRADATAMPFADDSFDGAYLVTVLGEVPDQEAALRELKRVARPGGRIVVGELFGDPHMVTRGALAERAEAAGLQVDRVLGGRLWHYTRLAVA